MKTDVAIVGGGPAGTAAAMFLIREGIKPVIVEAEKFPRYHIGESLTGGGGQVLRELGLEGEMYKRRYPCKQGVKVYGHSKAGSWFVPVTGRDAHWKLFPWDTWQVRRSDFDKMMLDEAVSRGATLIPGKALKPIRKNGSVSGVTIRPSDSDKAIDIESDLLMDCSGQATWLANLGNVTGPKYVGSYDKQIAIFSQVANTIRDNGTTRDQHKDNTLIFYASKFHWAWFIPLDDQVVSVGVVIPSAYFLDKKETPQEFLVREIHELHPELKRRVPEIKLVEQVHVIPNYSFQVKRFCGKGFICLGDAHRFVDPIFSFGATMAMWEGQLAAPKAKAYLNGAGRDQKNPFADHQLYCEKGIDVLEDLIDCFWERPLQFALLVYNRYTDYITDMFATRIYDHQPSPALDAFRKLLNREGVREKSYETEDLYSVPIGSRFHPERAAIWETNSPVQSTEEWLGPR
jgi:1H-pyrrole-2-carbonyl-[peptidyl-carrier protein] brominase